MARSRHDHGMDMRFVRTTTIWTMFNKPCSGHYGGHAVRNLLFTFAVFVIRPDIYSNAFRPDWIRQMHIHRIQAAGVRW